jgi:hypothetical protein
MTLDGVLTPFSERIWLATDPVRPVWMRVDATMTVIRLSDDSLLLHSPVAMTPARRAAVEALGRVDHLYAPNLYHHRWIGEWAAAFPSARLHAPAGLARKRRDLRIDRVHGATPEPAFSGVIDELPIDGCRLQESVIVYRPERTLVLADLVFNVGRPEHGWTRLYSRWTGFYDRVALSSVLRWLAFSDRVAARRSIDALLALPFDRVIVGHGQPVTAEARAALAAAYEWLPPVRAGGGERGGMVG